MQDVIPVAARANPVSTARIAGHPIHPMLVPFPIACFVGTLFTDLALLADGRNDVGRFFRLAAVRRSRHGSSGRDCRPD